MRSASAAPPSDLTARARLREAAIRCFAQEGFDASVRTIAASAGVSPGLIAHHFGSKQALREACDTEVLREYHEAKAEGVGSPSAQLISGLSAPGTSSTLLVYILRVVLSGGAPARSFLDRLIDDSRDVMAASVASGLARPSRDEEARLRYLVLMSLGALAVEFVTSPATSPEEFVASLRSRRHDAVLPMLELYTEGLLLDRSLLDDYLALDPPSTAP